MPLDCLPASHLGHPPGWRSQGPCVTDPFGSVTQTKVLLPSAMCTNRTRQLRSAGQKHVFHRGGAEGERMAVMALLPGSKYRRKGRGERFCSFRCAWLFCCTQPFCTCSFLHTMPHHHLGLCTLHLGLHTQHLASTLSPFHFVVRTHFQFL